MKTLIDTLKKETEILKDTYLLTTKEWAVQQLERNIVRRKDYHSKKISDYLYKQLYHDEQKWTYNSPRWYFTTEFIDKMISSAIEHYDDSIIKLAVRICKKGLDIEKISVKSSRIGINLDMVVTDGTKTIHAYTIVAEGNVQKPHYRYLIK